MEKHGLQRASTAVTSLPRFMRSLERKLASGRVSLHRAHVLHPDALSAAFAARACARFSSHDIACCFAYYIDARAYEVSVVVGTGCAGPMQARMAILKAARQLAVEANVHVHIRKFSVINQARLRSLNTRVIPSAPQEPRWGVAQVGAVSIDAKLDCERG